jgi:sulfate transport system permease protein
VKRPPHEIAMIALALVITIVLIGLPVATILAQAWSSGLGIYLQLAHDPLVLAAARLTLVAALGAVAFNTVFGLLAGWTLSRYRFWGKAALASAIELPLSISPVISGLGILLLVGARTPLGAFLEAHGIRVAFATPGIVFATILIAFPFVAREFAAVLEQRGIEQEETSLTLGATAWQTFLRVTLPSARWALIDGILLCAARSVGEFGAVAVVSGNIQGVTETLPLRIGAQYDEYQITAAFATASLLAFFAVIVGAGRYVVRRHVEQRWDENPVSSPG